MLRLGPYKIEDADTIISWSKDEKAFYQWSLVNKGTNQKECNLCYGFILEI